MIFLRRWVVIGVALGWLAASVAFGREWHRADGTVFCEGKLLSAENGKLRVLANSGATVVIALKELSLDDAEFVAQALRNRADLLGESPSASASSEKPPATEPAAEPKTTATEAPAASPGDRFPLTNPNVTSWQAHPDPPAWNWTEPLDPLRVARLPTVDRSEGFVMPLNPSPYLAIASPRGEYRIWDRWDLTTGQRDGVVRGAPQQNGWPAMSTDGKLLAVLPQRNDDAIQVWSFDTGNRVGRIELSERGYSQNSLAFVADHGLIMRSNRDVPSIFDVFSGRERASLRNGYVNSDTRTAVSPGEHYLAVFQQQSGRVGLIDTRNGAVAGDLLIPDLDQEYTNCDAFGFSSNGTRLWALIGRFRAYRLVAWNLADASCVVNLKLDTLASIRAQDSDTAEKVPDFLDLPTANGILLKGSLLLDSKTGAVVWEHGGGDDSRQLPVLRLIGESQMLVLQRSDGKSRIAVEPIPFDEIKASRDLIAKGGTAQDLGLPPLTQVSWKDVDRGRNIADADAKYEPQPVSSPPDLREQLALKPGTDDRGRLVSQGFTFAGGDSPWCASLYNVVDERAAATRRSMETSLETYRLSTGERGSRTTLPRAASILDLAPDGSQAVVASTQDGRIDLWDLRSDKHQVGFRPAGLRDNRGSAAYAGASGFPIAKLITGGRLLTAHTSGEMVLWSIDGFHPIYSLKTLPASVAVLDQSRTYVLAQDAKGVRVCRVESGNAVATLPAEQLPSNTILMSAAFCSSGKNVAMLIQYPMGSRLIVWNIPNGKVEWNTPLPFLARQVAWSGDDLLLASLMPRSPYGQPYPNYGRRTPNGPNYERQFPDAGEAWRPDLMPTIVRVSPDERRFVWQYRGKSLPGQPNQSWYQYQSAPWQLVGQTAVDRAWLSNGRSSSRPVLISMAGRTAEENEAIQKKLTMKRASVSGDKISVEVEVGPLPEILPRAAQRRDEFRTSIEADLKKRLAAHTITAPAGKSLKLQASLRERRASDLLAPGGRTPMFGPGMPNPYNISPNGPDGLGILARLELRTIDSDEDDDPLWLTESWFAQERMMPVNADLQSTVQLLIPWERAIEWLDNQPLPDSLVDPKQFQPVGTTELSPENVDVRE